MYLHRTLGRIAEQPSRGDPDYLDASDNGKNYWIQDGGTPNVMNKYF